MEDLIKRAIPGWSTKPIPNLYLSASGLVALADLSTIAQRTAIVGGSSWLDMIVLAPGLHYQQAADAVSDHISEYCAIEMQPGKTALYRITNPATIRFLQRVGKDGDPIIVDVGMSPQRQYFSRQRRRRGTGQRTVIWHDQSVDLGLLSHLLYLASPLITICAFVFMALVEEWWGISLMLGLILARLLNIWVIKQRAKPRGPSTSLPSKGNSSRSTCSSDDQLDLSNLLTEYIVDLGHGRSVCLRGLAEDLKAVTATQWLASKTHIEDYLQATGTVIVYIVACLSGNMTQTGQIILAATLVANAALLGLSNGHAKTLRMHGRIAAPTSERLARLEGVNDSWTGWRRDGSESHFGSNRGGGGAEAGKSGPAFPDSMASVSWPPSARTTSREQSYGRESSLVSSVFDDYAEKGQISKSVRFPFE